MTGLAATVLETFEGDDPAWLLTLWDEDTDGPFDLTGASAIEFTIKTDPDDVAVLLTGTAAAEGVPTLGVVSLACAVIATPGDYVWRLRLTRGGKTRTVAAGPLVVKNA